MEKSGGLTYITDLAQNTPSAANYKYYFDIVKRDSVNRRLIRASKDIIEESMSGADSADSVAFAEKLIFDISKKLDTSTLVDMREDDSYDLVLSKFETISTDKNALRGVNDSLGAMESWNFGELLNGSGLSPEEVIEQIEAVTAQQVKEALAKFSLSVTYRITKEGAPQ